MLTQLLSMHFSLSDGLHCVTCFGNRGIAWQLAGQCNRIRKQDQQEKLALRTR